MYHLVVVAVVVVHFAFLGYLIVGGFIALRWRRTIWLHVPTVLWGIAIAVGHLDCPLTWLERLGRKKAGMPPLPQEASSPTTSSACFIRPTGPGQCRLRCSPW
jgi:hypothetical protein